MQSTEEETVKYSETFKKGGFNSSLTYCKLKNNGVENCNNILNIKVLKGKTRYRPLSNIRRIKLSKKVDLMWICKTSFRVKFRNYFLYFKEPFS